MKTQLSLALFALSASLFACNATIVNCEDGDCCDDTEDCCEGAGCNVGGNGAGGEGGQGGQGGSSDEGIAVSWEALGNQVAPAPDGTLLLSFGSETSLCANPLADQPACEVPITWRAQIPLPVEMQTQGAVINLEDLLGVGFGPFVSLSEQEPGELCSGGGGTMFGTLTVLSISDTQVTIRLDDADLFDVGLNGERTLLRCGDTPDPQSAVALTQAQLNDLFGQGGSSSSSTTGGGPSGGPAPSDDLLFVFLDNSAQPAGLSCQNPYAVTETCEFDRQVVSVGLWLEQQVPGIYPMTEVNVGTSDSGPNGDGTCWGGGSGGYSDGYVEVLASDDSSISVRVVGGPVAGSLEAVAPRCP